MTSLPTVVTLIIALSVATERFVEIVKGVVPWLSLENTDPRAEARRRAALQFLAVVGGVVISALAWPITRQIIPDGQQFSLVLALGLLASGGSGFWNSILGYVTNLKNLQDATVQQVRKGAIPSPLALSQPSEGNLRP
jgi:hypothetical protein